MGDKRPERNTRPSRGLPWLFFILLSVVSWTLFPSRPPSGITIPLTSSAKATSHPSLCLCSLLFIYPSVLLLCFLSVLLFPIYSEHRIHLCSKNLEYLGVLPGCYFNATRKPFCVYLFEHAAGLMFTHHTRRMHQSSLGEIGEFVLV